MRFDNINRKLTESNGEGTYARIIYDYSEDWAAIDIYKNHEKVDEWDDYFGANETGNPLAVKFVEMAKANGLDPLTLPLVDENGDVGTFNGKTFKWEDGVSEEQVDEISKDTKASYLDKAPDDHYQMFTGRKPTTKHKLDKRRAHIQKVSKELTGKKHFADYDPKTKQYTREGSEEENYITVAVSSARKALEALADARIEYEADGSNHYIFADEQDVYDALELFNDWGVEVEHSNLELDESEEQDGPFYALVLLGAHSKKRKLKFKNQAAFEKWADAQEGDYELLGFQDIDESTVNEEASDFVRDMVRVHGWSYAKAEAEARKRFPDEYGIDPNANRNVEVHINGKAWKVVAHKNIAFKIKNTLEAKGKKVDLFYTDKPVTPDTRKKNESNDVNERKLTGGEKRSREANVKKLKKHKGDFEDRYGKDAESVMYAVATKRAKGESVEEASTVNGVKMDGKKRWKSTQLSYDDAVAKYGKSNVKKGMFKRGTGEDDVQVYVEGSCSMKKKKKVSESGMEIAKQLLEATGGLTESTANGVSRDRLITALECVLGTIADDLNSDSLIESHKRSLAESVDSIVAVIDQLQECDELLESERLDEFLPLVPLAGLAARAAIGYGVRRGAQWLAKRAAQKAAQGIARRAAQQGGRNLGRQASRNARRRDVDLDIGPDNGGGVNKPDISFIKKRGNAGGMAAGAFRAGLDAADIAATRRGFGNR